MWAPRLKPVTVIAEARLKDRSQHLSQGLLNEPIQETGNAEHPFASLGLVNFHSTNRLWAVSAFQQRDSQCWPLRAEPFREFFE